MKAIGYLQSKPINEPESLLDVELPKPTASGTDLLVKVSAISVNPVDFKIRQNVAPENGNYKVLGWDAVGEVVEVGENVEHYNVGDKVYYAGDLTRSGSNAEYQLVDERIVGLKPSTLEDSAAAALPLTTITAWELLFERLGIEKQSVGSTNKTDEVLLIVGAAGGVGSILVQLAKTLTGVTVIGTASRDSSSQWVKELGADHVINHRESMPEQIRELGFKHVTHVASLTHTDSYLDDYVDILAPMGKLALIDDPASLDISKLKVKSLSLHWEFMFTRSMFQTKDMDKQRQLLTEVAQLVDQGSLKTTLGLNLGAINAKNLRSAHETLESGKAVGKIVLEGFDAE